MKDIFAEFYNKVIGFFRRTEEIQENTKDVARNRLRVVLMQDRTNLTPQLLERMRKELVELLSKYVEMDKEALELNLEQEGDQMALMLSIPVLRAKDEEEIEAALAEDNKEKSEDEDTAEELDDENIEEDEAAEKTETAEEDMNAEEDEAVKEADCVQNANASVQADAADVFNAGSQVEEKPKKSKKKDN